MLAKNFKLSRAQHTLLIKGLSFIPTLDISRGQKAQFQFNMQNYHHKIKSATYYRDSGEKQILPFMGTSTWTPPFEKLPLEIKTLIHEDWQIFKKRRPSATSSGACPGFVGRSYRHMEATNTTVPHFDLF